MMTLLTGMSRTEVGTLVLDVLVTEEIDLEGEVTRYPVEDGTTISDHVFQGPEIVRISGMVSEGDTAAFSFSSALGTRIADAIGLMRAMHAERQLVTVSTGKMLYEDMAFSRLSASRSADGEGGNWLTIKAELVKVRKVKLRTADAPAASPASGRTGQTQTPAGRSSPTSTPTEAAPRARTTAFGIFNP